MEQKKIERKKDCFLIQQYLAFTVFIHQMICDPSITYLLWFQCSFLQPHEVYFGSSFPVQVLIAKDWAWPHLAVLFLQPHSTTVSSMTVSGFCSPSAWSPTQRLGTRQKQHTTVALWSGNLFTQPQLEFTELNKQLSVKRFLRKKTLALLYQLSILLPAATFRKKTIFPQWPGHGLTYTDDQDAPSQDQSVLPQAQSNLNPYPWDLVTFFFCFCLLKWICHG